MKTPPCLLSRADIADSVIGRERAEEFMRETRPDLLAELRKQDDWQDAISVVALNLYARTIHVHITQRTGAGPRIRSRRIPSQGA